MELGKTQAKPYLTVALLVALAILLIFATPALNFINAKRISETINNGISNGIEALQPIKNATDGIVPIAKKIFEPPKTEAEIAEAVFLEHAHEINRNFTTVFFETHLIRVGFFKSFDESLNQPRDVFRADYYVKNTQPEPHNFYPDEAKVWYNLDNYTATSWNFTSVSVEPDEERYAYVLFNTVPRSVTGPVVITVGTTRAYSPIFSEIIVVPYGFNVTLPLLARPRSALG